MILQCRNKIKVSIELPVATRHCRDMTEKLLKATLNPNKQQQERKGCAYYNVHSRHTNQTMRFDQHVLSPSVLRDPEIVGLRHIYHLTERDRRMLTCIASDVRDRVRNRGQDNVTNINTGSGVRRIIFKRRQYMYKSEQRCINESLLTRNALARTHTQYFFGYSQEIINKISSLHSRLIFRRRLIRVYSVCS